MHCENVSILLQNNQVISFVLKFLDKENDLYFKLKNHNIEDYALEIIGNLSSFGLPNVI